MKTGIGMKISMIVINPIIQTVLIVEIGHMTETGYIIETGTIPENTKETGHMVEIDCKTTVEMSIRRKVLNIRGLEIIINMSMRTGTV